MRHLEALDGPLAALRADAARIEAWGCELGGVLLAERARSAVVATGGCFIAQADRAAVLDALGCADAVAVFEEDDPTAVVRELRPHVWVKGGDYAVGELPEAAVLADWGGVAVVVPYLTGRSTSRLIEVTRVA